ncbi:MAG: hypothetical protein P4L53_04385 [Candidatus Obscuribacterales bacterium]|nr:hypothetical protein [Candidatus Obscuribacterales bacterium]
MKRLFKAICNWHQALRDRNPGMPTLRQHSRMFFCVALMFVCFTLAARNPESRLMFGGLVGGVLALMTTMGVVFDDFEKPTTEDKDGSTS